MNTPNSVFGEPLVLEYGFAVRPGISRACLWAVSVWFPVTSAMWAAIIYGASRLIR